MEKKETKCIERHMHNTIENNFNILVATMIAMSVYAGHYTNEVDYEDRGFSFWLAWSPFPISLVAAFAALYHTIFQEIEEENEIILNVVPGN